MVNSHETWFFKWNGQKKGKLRKGSKKCGSFTYRKEIPSVTLVATITFRKPLTFSSFIQPCKTCRLLERHQKIVLFARVILRTKLIRFSCLFVCLFVCVIVVCFLVKFKGVHLPHGVIDIGTKFQRASKSCLSFLPTFASMASLPCSSLKNLSHRVHLSCFNHQSR